jgi:TolB-like protein/tetratricopeptide (TPR) repeat protein
MPIPEDALQVLPGGLSLDGRTGEIQMDGLRLSLPQQLFRLLALLGERSGEIVTREEIQKDLWSDSFVNFDDSINSAIRRLRQILGNAGGECPLIETVSGRGYRFVAAEKKASLVPELRASGMEQRKPRVAALSFDNLSGISEDGNFADSLTDAVITALAKVPAICVKPRCLVTGCRQLRGGLAALGRKLKVDAILQGSIVHSDCRLRVTAQLISVATEEHLWADTFLCDSGDFFYFQMDVAERISAQVSGKLAPAWKRRHSYIPPMPFANDSNLKAHHTFSTFTNDGFWKSRHYWKQAIRQDPAYAQAFAGLAESYNMLGMSGLLNAKDALDEAQYAAQRAVEIDESLAEAHLALAHTYAVQWKWEAAAREFRQALRSDPDMRTGNPCHYVEFLMAAGGPDESIREIERIRAAQPLAHFLGGILGWAYYATGNYDQAIRQHHEALKDDPRFAMTHVLLGLDFSQKKRYRAAIEHCGRVTSNPGIRLALNALGYIYATAGDKHRAKEILGELKRLQRTSYASFYATAAIYAGMGDLDAAFESLDRACEVHQPELIWLKWDPQLDNLRSDPRFQGVLDRIGLHSAQSYWP